jgi:hypothetical protein
LVDVEFWVGIDTDITNLKATEAARCACPTRNWKRFRLCRTTLRSPLNTINGSAAAGQTGVCFSQ